MFLAVILLVLIGLLFAVLGSLVGVGGDITIIPTLVHLGVSRYLLYGITTQIATDTSSVILIVAELSPSVSYLKIKQIDIKNGSIFLLGLLPGSLIGSFLSRYLTLNLFNLYFGTFTIYVSILLMIRRKIKPFKIFDREKYHKTYIDAKEVAYHYSTPPMFTFLATLFIDILTGLFRIGGGALMTPLMLIVFRFSPHVVVRTNATMIFFSSVMSSIGHIIQGCVTRSYSIVLIISSYTGAQIGIKMSHSIKSKTVILLLRTVISIMGAYLVTKSFL